MWEGDPGDSITSTQVCAIGGKAGNYNSLSLARSLLLTELDAFVILKENKEKNFMTSQYNELKK